MSALTRIIGTNLLRRNVALRTAKRGVASAETLVTKVSNDVPIIKFETIEETASPVITGAIIPWSDMGTLQYIVLPYSLSSMYYIDKLLDFMPWSCAIPVTTLSIRLLFLPLMIKQNIVGIKLYNLMPQTQRIQAKLNQAALNGNSYETNLQKTNLALLYREHDLSIWQRLWPTLIQAPMFLSMFVLLRQLANYQVAGLVTGGALWFSNLTVPDPYYVLPASAALSTWLLMNYGLEGSTGISEMGGPAAKWFVRLLPVGIFAFTLNFPAAVTLYWTTNNALTLLLSVLMRQNWTKQKFGIPHRLKHDPESLPMNKQSFMGQVNSALDQTRSKKTTMDVRRLDDIAFRKAGVGPLRKTYKTNPKEQG